VAEDSGLTAPIETAPQATPQLEKPGFQWTPRLVIWAVLLLVVLVFVLQNLDDTRINVLWLDYTPPLALIVGIFFLLGYLLGWLRPRFRAHRKS
jgi:uncharacterized integral membrane protein